MADELHVGELRHIGRLSNPYIVVGSSIQARAWASNVPVSRSSVVVCCVARCWDLDTTDSGAGQAILSACIGILGGVRGGAGMF